MVEGCLSYSCDSNYLLPTIVSSIQARRNLSTDLADVVVIVVGGFNDPRGAIKRLLKESGVKLRIADPREIDNLSVMFARHYLDGLLEPHYKRIIHIDSDTQVAGNLDPLFEVDLAPGHLMASRDPLAVRIHESGRFWEATRGYFKSIGLPDRHFERYVNTGLYGGARGDMASASGECVKLVQSKGPMRWHEQDGMNIVVGDRFQHLSFKWNFASFFINCGFNALIQPRIVHFMSNPRPWQGPFKPWGQPAYDVYIDQVRQEPDLQPYLNRVPKIRSVKYDLQQRWKRAIESRTWTRPGVLLRLAELENSAIA